MNTWKINETFSFLFLVEEVQIFCAGKLSDENNIGVSGYSIHSLSLRFEN